MKNKIQINTDRTYTVEEAVKLLPEVSTSKFVGSVDIDVVLNLKDKQKKEVVRGSVVLPFSLGDEKQVLVICEEKDQKTALEAGAKMAGIEVIDYIIKGNTDFDVVIATPSMMGQLAKTAKILGPKGLMPNPKNGTVTTDIAKTVSSFKAGKINFKSVADQGAIRLKVAKVNMKEEEILENIITAVKSIFNEAKRLNSNPFKKIVISPTMGPGLKLDINDIIKRI